METQNYPVTTRWENALEKSRVNHPHETVFHPLTPTGQSEVYSCGTAILASVIGGKETEIIQLVKDELQQRRQAIEDAGTPPDIMKKILRNHNIEFTERPSDASFSQPEVKVALDELKRTLLSGKICLTPIQSTPELYIAKNVIGDNGKIIQTMIKPESVWLDELGEEEYYIQKNEGMLQTPKTSLKQDHPKSTAQEVDENGHWIAVVGMMKKGNRNYFITVDPWYKNEQETVAGINPNKTGYRLIEEHRFGRVWHDRSADGINFNQYMIAVKAPKGK